LFRVGVRRSRESSLLGEYEVYDNVDDEDTTGESDVHMRSLGVPFKF
jgi:hypothetical protein